MFEMLLSHEHEGENPSDLDERQNWTAVWCFLDLHLASASACSRMFHYMQLNVVLKLAGYNLYHSLLQKGAFIYVLHSETPFPYLTHTSDWVYIDSGTYL